MLFKQYEIHRYNSSFESQLLQLLTHLWSTNLRINADYLNWKYKKNPYTKSHLMYIAIFKGQVVGVLGFYQTCWELSGIPRSTVCISDADAVVHPKHRRQGILKAITKMALTELEESEYEYIFTLSASPITHKNNLKLGWKSVCKVGIARRIKQQDIHRLVVSSLSPSIGESKTFQNFESNIDAFHNDIASHIVITKSPRLKEMAELIGRIRGDRRIRHVRDLEYLTWRFKNPLNEYLFLFWERDRLEGYLVLQSKKKYLKNQVCIVDWEAVSTEILYKLLTIVLSYGEFEEVTVCSSTLPADVRSVLRKSGFEIPDEGTGGVSWVYEPSILVRRLQNKVSPKDWNFMGCKLLEGNNWDLRAVYSDYY